MLGMRTSSTACRPAAAQQQQQLRAGACLAPRPSAISRRSLLLRAAAEIETKTVEGKKKKAEPEFSDEPDIGPTTAQVQSFLNTLCGETAVAQVELKLGSFSLKVTRSLESADAAAPAHAAAPAAPEPAAPAPVIVLNAGAAAPYESIDEALVYVTSPKVGIFRRGKYAAGKRVGKGDMVKAGDTLRGGQTVAFVEQLGTFVDIKTTQGGEVVKFRVSEGEPVEYGQVVCDIAPQFGSASPSSF